MGKKHKKPVRVQTLCEGSRARAAWEGTWSSSPTRAKPSRTGLDLVVALYRPAVLRPDRPSFPPTPRPKPTPNGPVLAP